MVQRVLAALTEPDGPHSRKAAAAAKRHDLTLMQPLSCILVEYSVTLAVLDLHCATNVFPELCTLGFCSLPVCAAFRSAYGKLEFSTTLFAHFPEVLAVSRNQMLRICGKLGCDRLSRGTTRPHTDAATALRVCIYIEFRDSCSVGPSLSTKVKISNEKCSLYTGLLSQFVEFSATLWFEPRIRGKVASPPISTFKLTAVDGKTNVSSFSN